MDTRFHTLLPQTPLSEAVKVFMKASEERKQKIFGLIVLDESGHLAGMLSMYDILLLMRPKHVHIWGEMDDIEVAGFLNQACQRIRAIQVGDIMTTDVITITPETHILLIVDIMIKKHIRRLPVVEEGRVVGIVYLSKVFYYLMEWLGR